MGVLLGADGRPMTLPKPAKARVRASYDAASTNTRNERYYANSDNKSATAATSPDVRKKLRERARYEVANNSYAAGIVRTLANNTIGTGPRLQLIIPGRADAARFAEREFRLWTYEAKVTQLLHTFRQSKCVDGEVFGAFVNNPALPTPVQLALREIECDYIRSPWWQTEDTEENADGVLFDRFGNPTEYLVQREHPGSDLFTEFGAYDTVPAADMIHMFRRDRPGQRRGVPEITSALELFGHLRRFTKATLHAAETAASYAGVLYTDDPDTAEDSIDAEAGDVIEVEHNSLLVLPNGRKLGQMKAEHPTTTYPDFEAGLVRQMARCISMPYAIAAGDSSRGNYASGRLDHQTYDQSLDIERDYLATECLDRTLIRWLDEALLIPNYMPPGLPPVVTWDWVWFWDSRGHVDPLKEANAQKARLGIGTTTRYREYQREGYDLDAEDERAARSYGVTIQEYRQALFRSAFGPEPVESEPAETEDEEFADAD